MHSASFYSTSWRAHGPRHFRPDQALNVALPVPARSTIREVLTLGNDEALCGTEILRCVSASVAFVLIREMETAVAFA